METTQNNNTIMIDIRGNFAFSLGHINGSINILDELFTQIIEQGNCFGKDKTIIVTCAVGKISPKYAHFLKKQGYNAFSLEGGINNWKKTGLSLIKTL
jgi:cysteine synthase B